MIDPDLIIYTVMKVKTGSFVSKTVCRCPILVFFKKILFLIGIPVKTQVVHDPLSRFAGAVDPDQRHLVHPRPHQGPGHCHTPRQGGGGQ